MAKDILLFRFLYLVVARIHLLHLQTEEITPYFYVQPAELLTSCCSFSGLPEGRKITGARQCSQSCQDIFLIPWKWQTGGMASILPRIWHLPQVSNTIWLAEMFWAQLRFVACSCTNLWDNADFTAPSSRQKVETQCFCQFRWELDCSNFGRGHVSELYAVYKVQSLIHCISSLPDLYI